MNYVTFGIKALITLAFISAGAAKLAGVQMMIGTFDAIGIGQWFRYLTGIVEVGGAVLLWINGRQAIGAALLAATMAGAVLAHLLILGPSAVPALILGLLSAAVFWKYRNQVLPAQTA